MYHVIIIEDDPMVASINKQYIEVPTSVWNISSKTERRLCHILKQILLIS